MPVSLSESDAERAAQHALETYRSAVFAKDVDAFMSLYAPDVRLFDTWEHWSCEGAAAWRESVTGWFQSLQTDTCRVDFEEVRISAGEGFAVVSAFARYAAVSAQGQELRFMQNRLSWMLRRDGEGWRIVHEHTSVPIGPGMKALLQRHKSASSK